MRRSSTRRTRQTKDQALATRRAPERTAASTRSTTLRLSCLRGAWGYHSVLHADRPMGDSTLLAFLLELQKVLDE